MGVSIILCKETDLYRTLKIKCGSLLFHFTECKGKNLGKFVSV